MNGHVTNNVTCGCVANWRVSQCNGAASLDEATLTLQVKRSGTRKYRGMSLSVSEFIRRWLQHLLPCGLHRIRRYGLLHPSSGVGLEELRILIAVALDCVHYFLSEEQIVTAEQPAMQCEQCGGAMISLGYIPPTLETTDQPTRAPP